MAAFVAAHFGDILPSQAMALHLFAAIATLLFVIFVIQKSKPKQIKGVEPDYDTSRWFWSALPLLVAGSMNFLNRQSSILLLGALSTSDQVGLYRVAQKGADMILFSGMAVNMTIGPTISKLFTEGDMQKIQRIITTSARAILAFSYLLHCF